MMFNQFIARLAPLFAGLGLIKAFRLEDVAKPKETELPRSEQESCTRKQKFSLHSKGRQKKQMRYKPFLKRKFLSSAGLPVKSYAL